MSYVLKTIQVGNNYYDIVLRRQATSRRLSLRYAPLKRHCVLSAPKQASKGAVSAFLKEAMPSMREYLRTLPEPVVLEHGSVVPILGEPHLLVASEDHDTGKTNGTPPFVVPASPAQCPTMTKQLLEKALRDYIHQQVATLLQHPAYAEYEGQPTVSLRDTTSRWGSCSSEGRLMFSWRLVFAPRNVLDYVIAHECAHLIHPNHSRDFWALNEVLCTDMQASKDWLATHGSELFRYRESIS